jgi:serine/threonine protein kinase
MIMLHSADSLLMWEQCSFQILLFAEPPKDLIRKLLVVDPKKRITIKEALEHPFFQMMVRILTSSAVLCSCGSLVP